MLTLLIIMQNLFTNISLFFLSVLVVFLSIGISISKMHCSQVCCPENGNVFIGTEVPNCIEKQEIECNTLQNELSCCTKKEIESSCFSEKDNDCSSITTNIQFEFETLTTSFDFNFKQLDILLYSFILYNEVCYLNLQLNYIKEIPLLEFSKPEIAEIQSFLL